MRNSIEQNRHASFLCHWEKASNALFGDGHPVNITSKRNIFQDRMKRNFHYFKNRLPDPQSAFIRHITADDEDLNEQFIHIYDGMKFYCLPSKLKLLSRHPVTGDGTWSPCRFLKEKQMYILCANVCQDKKVIVRFPS